MSGVCGLCTLCCTVMKVAMEPPKPARTKCPHECRSGCSIYADRPEPCRVFECLWLASQTRMDEPMDRALRPDHSGVVLELNSAGYIVAHSKQPAAWRREPMFRFLRSMTRSTRVLIEPGDGVLFLNPDGSTRDMDFVGVDPTTNERLYKIRVPE